MGLSFGLTTCRISIQCALHQLDEMLRYALLHWHWYPHGGLTCENWRELVEAETTRVVA